jgi:hypothetical protein
MTTVVPFSHGALAGSSYGMWMQRWWVLVVAGLSGAALIGCGSEDDPVESSGGPLEVAGSYTWEDGGAGYDISQTEWDGETILEYDNARNRAVLSDPSGGYGYSTMFWKGPTDGKLFTCRLDYGLDSAEAAKASKGTPDGASPRTGGCDAVAWNVFDAH